MLGRIVRHALPHASCLDVLSPSQPCRMNSLRNQAHKRESDESDEGVPDQIMI